MRRHHGSDAPAPHLLQPAFLVALLTAGAIAPGPPNPYSTFAAFDCELRKLALDFALELQPHRGRDDMQAIADALNSATFAECRNLSIPAGVPPPSPPAPALPVGPGVVYVAVDGSDSAAGGTISSPLRTLAAAVAKVAALPAGRAIVLRQGTHYLAKTLELGAHHTGLRIVNYPGEQVFISGAVPISAKSLRWIPTPANPRIVQADLSSVSGLPAEINGLRINGRRAIRARYPNFDPELGFGPGLTIGRKGPNGTGFLPVLPPGPLTVINPSQPNRSSAGAVGVYQRFNFGIGGPCAQFTPPAGYWCGTATGGGGGKQYSGVPTGIMVGNHLAEVLPRFPWQNPAGAIVDMFSNAQMWSNWMFEVSHTNSSTIFFERGGFQGSRGCGNSKGQTQGCGYQFYVENVIEEVSAITTVAQRHSSSLRLLPCLLPSAFSVTTSRREYEPLLNKYLSALGYCCCMLPARHRE
jgi:hypothetical protein